MVGKKGWSWRYRLWQLGEQLIPRPLNAAERAEVTALLTWPQLALFDRFGASDQRHGLRVLNALQARGVDSPELLLAALLHDVGKTRFRLTLRDRVAIVLGQAFWPARLAAWGRGEPRGWRRPFVIKARHPDWGAEMVAAAGAPALTVELIARHQDPIPGQPATPVETLLAELQAVDDTN